MENQPAESVPPFSANPKDISKSKPDPSSPSKESQPSEPRSWSDVSPQSSSKTSPTDESKPEESSPTDSSPFGIVSLGALSNSQKGQGSPQSQKTILEETKPVRCARCNPVHICLVFGLAVAVGSVAMTVCGYMSHQIALHTVMVGNETVTVTDEELLGQIEKFKTFGPVLIGLGSFISMCACVLLCEAKDEKKREAKKLLVEEQESNDYMTRQEHMYALQREVMECEARHKSCPLYREALACPHVKQQDDVAFADESSHSSPVVQVHGPSLAEEKQRNDSQESNESDAAKGPLLRGAPRIETTDATSIPTCSNYVGPETELETSFTATPRTTRKGFVSASPPIKPKNTKPERPSNLPPIKSWSVNGPITLHAGPYVEGVCSCEEEPIRMPPKGAKSKRVKRGTRQRKDKHLENKTTGSDSGSAKSVPIQSKSNPSGAESGSAKSVPRYSKSVATQNTDLVTHVNPLHDIPLDSFPQKSSPHRTQTVDLHKATDMTSTVDRLGAVSSLAPVENPRDSRLSSSKISKGHTNKGHGNEPGSPIWVKQKPRDSPTNNNNYDLKNSDKTSEVDVGGALCNPVSDKVTGSSLSDAACDSNSNVPSMSSMQATPANAMYDVIHDKTQHAHSSKSEVVL